MGGIREYLRSLTETGVGRLTRMSWEMHWGVWDFLSLLRFWICWCPSLIRLEVTWRPLNMIISSSTFSPLFLTYFISFLFWWLNFIFFNHSITDTESLLLFVLGKCRCCLTVKVSLLCWFFALFTYYYWDCARNININPVLGLHNCGSVQLFTL